MSTDRNTVRKNYNAESSVTDLQDVNASSSDMADDLVVLVEMPAKHLGRLVHGVFNLDSHTGTLLRLLHNLLTASKT